MVLFSPIIITLIFTYYLFFRLTATYLTFFKKSASTFLQKKNNYFNQKYTSFLILFLLAVYFYFFLKGAVISNSVFLLNNQVAFIFLSGLGLFYLFINFNVQLSGLKLISMLLYLIVSFFLLLSKSFLFLLLSLEFLFYVFILVVISSSLESRLLVNPKTLTTTIFNLIVINFSNTVVLYITLFSALYLYGFSSLIFVNTSWLSGLITLSILLKLSVGPWFLWNLNIYQNLVKINLVFYILFFLSLNLVPLVQILLLHSTLVTQYLFTFLIILGFFINYGLYSTTTLKQLLLYSSYTVYVFIVLLLSI